MKALLPIFIVILHICSCGEKVAPVEPDEEDLLGEGEVAVYGVVYKLIKGDNQTAGLGQVLPDKIEISGHNRLTNEPATYYGLNLTYLDANERVVSQEYLKEFTQMDSLGMASFDWALHCESGKQFLQIAVNYYDTVSQSTKEHILFKLEANASEYLPGWFQPCGLEVGGNNRLLQEKDTLVLIGAHTLTVVTDLQNFISTQSYIERDLPEQRNKRSDYAQFESGVVYLSDQKDQIWKSEDLGISWSKVRKVSTGQKFFVHKDRYFFISNGFVYYGKIDDPNNWQILEALFTTGDHRVIKGTMYNDEPAFLTSSGILFVFNEDLTSFTEYEFEGSFSEYDVTFLTSDGQDRFFYNQSGDLVQLTLSTTSKKVFQFDRPYYITPFVTIVNSEAYVVDGTFSAHWIKNDELIEQPFEFATEAGVSALAEVEGFQIAVDGLGQVYLNKLQ